MLNNLTLLRYQYQYNSSLLCKYIEFYDIFDFEIFNQAKFEQCIYDIYDILQTFYRNVKMQ